MLGVPAGQQGDVVPLAVVGTPVEGSRGLGDQVAETGEDLLLRFNQPEVRAVGVPGAGAVASASDIALFYQSLLHNSADVWASEVLRDATSTIRNRLTDELFGCPANRTLGLVVAGDDDMALSRGFGRSVGPRTFGAMGVGGQVAWADPDSGLSFGYVTNALDVDIVGSFMRSAKISGLAARTAC